MKYMIEETENGCIETLEFSDGRKFTKESFLMPWGCESHDPDFAEQLEESGFDDDTVERVWNLFDGFGALDFLSIARTNC